MLFPNEWWSCYSADNDRPVLDSLTHTHTHTHPQFTPHSFSFPHQLGKIVEYETIFFHFTDHLAVCPKMYVSLLRKERASPTENLWLCVSTIGGELGVYVRCWQKWCVPGERYRAMSWLESIRCCWVRDIWSGQMPVRSLITPTSHYDHWSINLSRQAGRPHVYDYKEKYPFFPTRVKCCLKIKKYL